MKAILGLGKLVTLVFWGAVLVNLLHPFAYPLNWLLSIAGGLILLIHLIEILVLGGRLKARAHPWLDRLQVLLFGVFHMLALPALSPASELPQDKEDDHA
ncbi:DUF1145 domain-containing protein [Pseudomonas aeruginosa]|uniref:DUF1145 domain-containing protein n=1 Tax=Pseudomonas aeruginosa TaxID=287 RepID=UPI0015F0C56E|nr:DUF1145 domain-containing protein [Pseudomonas aeruginosa]MBA5103360.1 DUF1145 domain-containing protein [Pseudomonas aeruginosa]MBV5844839.1 DUF1145 domain-containing protein [Pseudomonas aeruginosa]MDK6933370.1 DUF1145 domain-containing protein [Pseudomonas aeruginosa]MDP5991500.1 DUF1145 domain-containing protein [Pseudomonas aeruginosa]HBO5940010.1 DUF1145 domain-containing protein [Pseudomonas aeruginosa]